MTAEAMDALHQRFHRLWHSGEVERLLLIPAYVLDFVCIHPLLDGNGRMARLLSLLLLYQAGYEVGRFISLERTVERTLETYYEALYRSSQGGHDGEHSLLPSWEYFLAVMTATAYGEFERRLGVLTSSYGAKREMVIEVVGRLPQQFRYTDVERFCPGVSRPTIIRALMDLRQQGKLRSNRGRNAIWEKCDQ